METKNWQVQANAEKDFSQVERVIAVIGLICVIAGLMLLVEDWLRRQRGIRSRK